MHLQVNSTGFFSFERVNVSNDAQIHELILYGFAHICCRMFRTHLMVFLISYHLCESSGKQKSLKERTPHAGIFGLFGVRL
jgi:hypothetical protein